MSADSDLLELAGQCLRGETPVYALAEAIATHRGERLALVMFGAIRLPVNETKVRGHLKAAHYAATRPDRDYSMPSNE